MFVVGGMEKVEGVNSFLAAIRKAENLCKQKLFKQEDKNDG